MGKWIENRRYDEINTTVDVRIRAPGLGVNIMAQGRCDSNVVRVRNTLLTRARFKITRCTDMARLFENILGIYK